MLNKKMLLAPVIAIILAFLLVGAVSSIPQNISQKETPTEINGSTNESVNAIFFGIAALLIGAVAAFLFFSEKKLNEELLDQKTNIDGCQGEQTCKTSADQ